MRDHVLDVMSLCDTVGTATEEREGVIFDFETELLTNSRELICRKADIDLYHAMALLACQMVMVMRAIADAVVVCAISKIDAIKESFVNQHIDHAVDCGPSEAWLCSPYFLPELVNSKNRSFFCEFNQPLFNNATRTRIALTHLINCGTDFVCDRHVLSLSHDIGCSRM